MSFQKRLNAGEFVVLAEMDTPKGVDISELVANARRIKGRVDAVVIPDMANGVMRMSSLGGGVVMHQQGMEAIIHICPRDRNRLSLQGDLLTAHVLGLQPLLVVDGDDMSLGDHIDAKPVNDLDTLGLLAAVRGLQEGVDLAGIDLRGAPAFLTGCAMGSWANDAEFEAQLEKAKAKIKAGARYVVCPPVFDVEKFSSRLGRLKELGAPLAPTVFLLKSVGVARYMAVNMPGTGISDDLIKRIRSAPDRVAECLRIAGETVAALKGMVQGVYIQTLGWENRLPAILDHAGL
jgi:5,10-methylenetetrahydrofolate reductase